MKAQSEEMPTTLLRNKPYKNFPFQMYGSSGKGLSNLKLKAERSLDGGKFESCTYRAIEIGYGLFKIDFSAKDLSGEIVVFRFLGKETTPTYIPVETIERD